MVRTFARPSLARFHRATNKSDARRRRKEASRTKIVRFYPHDLGWTLLIPEEEIHQKLKVICLRHANIPLPQAHYVDYWQIYRRTCVSCFQIYKFTVQCKSNRASLATLQLQLHNLWQRTHRWTPRSLSRSRICRESVAPPPPSTHPLPKTPGWKNVLLHGCMCLIPGFTYTVIFLSLRTFLSLWQ